MEQSAEALAPAAVETPEPQARPRGLRQRQIVFVALGLAVLALALYVRTGGFEALDFDDGEYVFTNPDVLKGLATPGVRWAFGAFHSANWHPLTWLSHMLDVQLFGTAPGGHHLVNAAIHAANAAILFLVLRAATSAFWPSAIVAALFAVHPLNVESVAWISQRKSVLSTLFLLLAIGAYVRFARRAGIRRAGIVVALLILGLLAKPMLVSVPFLLLAIDFWPLERMGHVPLGRLVLEKIPLFVLAAVSSVVTMLAQAAGGAVAPTVTYPLGERIANALVSSVAYLRDAVWPAGLACFYPHPASIGQRTSWVAAVGAAVLLLAITAVAWLARRSRPWLLFGWAWYLFALAPVIGLVQVGSQARADRYAYVPLIGIFIAVVWEAFARVQEWRIAPGMAWAAASVAVGAFVLAAIIQIGYWRDAPTLYARALSVTEHNWFASNNMGSVLLGRGDAERAFAFFRQASLWKPDHEDAYYNAGVALIRLSRYGDAVILLRQNLKMVPDNTDGWDNLGYALVWLRRMPEALQAFETALSQRPDDAVALHGAGAMRAALGDRAAAFAYLGRLERVDSLRAAELRRDLATTR